MMEHDTPQLFCCLARDCNYRNEKLRYVNFKSALYCTRQNIVFKALGRSGSFLKLYMYIQIKTFMCTINFLCAKLSKGCNIKQRCYRVSQKQQF